MGDGVRRIGLLGGECTGKSTLAADLGQAIPACVVDERLRAFVDRHGRPPRRDEQRDLMLEQQAAEDAAAAECLVGVLIGDPAPLMTAVYSVAYFDDSSLIDEAVALAHGYDLLVWCGTDLPWEPDGCQRDGPHAREREHAIIADVVANRLDAERPPVVIVSGAGPDRSAAVRRAWQLLGLSTPT